MAEISRDWAREITEQDAISHGLTKQEFGHIIELVGRKINLLELGIFSALYSEHCSYKSSKVHLKTLPTTGSRVIHGPGENAGVVDIGDGLAIAFKVESHNHPSYIEPYQGAATGVGGILRDVFTMGARPIALMNSLRFGRSTHPKTRQLLARVVKGIGGYGNAIGVPTVGGETFFHESYDGNCLVNAMALGVVEKDKIFLARASGIGNPIFYVGSKTGRDGIHGATMSSEVFGADDTDAKRPTVQVGDPFVEKLLLEACLEVMASGAVVGIQDMGAAGLTSSIYETANKAGTGVIVHLDKVPQREAGMGPYELMLSESQERMLLIADRSRAGDVMRIFNHWGLDVVEIGQVAAGSNVELYWHGKLASSLPVSVVTEDVPQYNHPYRAPADFVARTTAVPLPGIVDDLKQSWMRMIGSINLCSRAPIFDQYDSTVRTNTVVHPGGDAAVVRIKGEVPEKGIAMTLDCNSRYCSIDPKIGTELSLLEAARNITAVGAEPIAISDCLNFGSPQNPEGMWEIAESIAGLGVAARKMSIPVVSGNVSLYNQTGEMRVLPTPTLAVVGLMADANKAVTAHFKNQGDKIFVLNNVQERDLYGSEYLANIHGLSTGPLPEPNYDLESKTAKFLCSAAAKGVLQSCHDLSQGGLGVGLVECCISRYNTIGAKLDVIDRSIRKDAVLFGEGQARYIISCKEDLSEMLYQLIQDAGIEISATGIVGGDSIEVADVASLALLNAAKNFNEGLECLLS